MTPRQVATFFRRLAAVIPAPQTELEYQDPYTLLVAVILSAQATDVGVNKATERLFRVANTPEGLVTEPTHNPIDWIIFSMSAMSPTAKQPWGLLPRNEWIQLIASIQLFIGVALAGLVGFVFGNTSRR